MRQLKVVTVGDSLGVALTQEELTHLDVKEGDTLCLTKAADGSFLIARRDSDFVHQVELARGIMRRDRDLLRALAK